jgi:hypothetical protein
MLKGRVGCKNRIVRLNNRVGHSWCGVNAELKLRLLAIVRREALKDERPKTRAGTTAERVEDEKSLETVAVVGKAPKLVHDNVNLLLADGVMTSCICVASYQYAVLETLSRQNTRS